MTKWLNGIEKEIPFPNTQPLATISVFRNLQRSYSRCFIISGIIQHVIFVFAFFPLAYCFWNPPLLSHGSKLHSSWDFQYGHLNEDRAFFPCVLWGHWSESPWIWTPTNISPLFWSWENSRKNNFRTFDLRNTQHQKFQLETNKNAYTPVKEPGWRSTCFHSEQSRSG